MSEILGENLDRRAIGLHLFVDCHIDLAGRSQKSLIRVFRGERNLALANAARRNSGRLLGNEIHDSFERELLVELQLDPENALLLSAAYGEIAVRRNRRDRLRKFVILLELRRLRRLRRGDFTLNCRLSREKLTDIAAHVGHISDALSDNIARELKLLIRRRESRRLVAVPYRFRERPKALLLSDLGACTALRLIRLIEVFKSRLLITFTNLFLELWSKFFLIGNGFKNRLFAGLKFRIIRQTLLNLADGDLIEISVHFLAVTRDERNGIAFTEKFFNS